MKCRIQQSVIMLCVLASLSLFKKFFFPSSSSLIYDSFTESTRIKGLRTTYVAILYRLQCFEIMVSLSLGLLFRKKNTCITIIISFGTLLRLKCYACKKKLILTNGVLGIFLSTEFLFIF